MPGHCPLCLKDLTEPVCIPCGHVYCSACIGSYATGHDKLTFKARCPLATCRQDFNLFIPDINALPKKFRTFVSQPMRRVHLLTWGSEDELRKERDKYEQVAESMRIANASLNERVEAASQEADYYKRKTEQIEWQHDQEKKNLEARIQILESRLTRAESRNERVLEAAVENSPRLGKRRRTSYIDENTLIANAEPMGKGKGVDRQSAESNLGLGQSTAPQTPNNPWMTRGQPKSPNSSKHSFRFAFRAPSTSLLALRGPQKRREYSRTAQKF